MESSYFKRYMEKSIFIFSTPTLPVLHIAAGSAAVLAPDRIFINDRGIIETLLCFLYQFICYNYFFYISAVIPHMPSGNF